MGDTCTGENSHGKNVNFLYPSEASPASMVKKLISDTLQSQGQGNLLPEYGLNSFSSYPQCIYFNDFSVSAKAKTAVFYGKDHPLYSSPTFPHPTTLSSFFSVLAVISIKDIFSPCLTAIFLAIFSFRGSRETTVQPATCSLH